MTKKEFYKTALDKSTKTNISTGAGLFYFAACATLAAGAIAECIPDVIADVVICLIIALAIHIGKSRVASVIGIVYGVFSVIISLVLNGALSGWLIPIGGICATIGTFKAAKAWNNYEKTGVIPAAADAPIVIETSADPNAVGSIPQEITYTQDSLTDEKTVNESE